MSFTPNNEPRVKGVSFTDNQLVVDLTDGRRVCVPLAFYPTLQRANARQRNRFDLIGPGIGIDWTDLDLQLSAQGILEGRPERVVTRRAGMGSSGLRHSGGSRPVIRRKISRKFKPKKIVSL